MGRKEDELRWNERLERIPISNIRPPRYPARRNPNPLLPEYCYFQDSVDQHGVLEPILVSYEGQVSGENVYELIDGNWRFTIARERGDTEINATVRDNVTDEERIAWSLILQEKAYAMQEIEYARALKKYIHIEEITQAELAIRLGWTTNKVSLYLRLNNLCEEAEQAVASGEISLTKACEIARVEPHKQMDFIEAAKLNNSNQLKRIVSRHQQRKAVGRNQRTLENKLMGEFIPSPHRKRWETIRNEINHQHEAKRIAQGMDPVEAFSEGVRWCVDMDKETLDKKRAAFEKRQERYRKEYARRIEGKEM